MWNETFSQINLELRNLHRLIDTYRPLLDKVKNQEPDNIEIAAFSSMLHSFYSGFENVFKRIAKDIDHAFEKSDSWHMDLLDSMVSSTKNRPAIISLDTKRKLQFYLSFRHVFRSIYSYDLKWSKMKELAINSEAILLLLEFELNTFIHSFENK
ncbi:MAG: hypothetical protein PHC61_02265 [Chitinivibrionales bacterium]|nr:hypothetical protein [Chitinivibrionales bacterium]